MLLSAEANHLSIDKVAVARSVKHLRQCGYVRAEPCAEDRRVRLLYLTEAGREMYHYLQQLNRQWVDAVLSGLDSWKIGDFERIIRHISEKARTLS